MPFLHERAIPSWRKAYLIEYLGRNQLKVGGPPPYYAVHTRRYLYVEYLNGWRSSTTCARIRGSSTTSRNRRGMRRLKASLHAELLKLESSPGEASEKR